MQVEIVRGLETVTKTKWWKETEKDGEEKAGRRARQCRKDKNLHKATTNKKERETHEASPHGKTDRKGIKNN